MGLITAGLNPNGASVASLFVGRGDVAVADKAPESLCNQFGIAIAKRTYDSLTKVAVLGLMNIFFSNSRQAS